MGVFITFNLLSFSLIFFRNPDLAHVAKMITTIFTNPLPVKVIIYDSAYFITMLVMLAVLLIMDFMVFRNNSFDSLYGNRKKSLFALSVTLFMLILLFGISSNTQFIYFQF